MGLWPCYGLKDEAGIMRGFIVLSTDQLGADEVAVDQLSTHCPTTTYKINTAQSSHIYSYPQSLSFSFSSNSQPPFPFPQEHRSDSQGNSHTHNDSLNTKNQSEPIALYPRRLKVSHREPAAGAPHIQNGRDTGRLLRVFFQCIGRDGTVPMMLEI